MDATLATRYATKTMATLWLPATGQAIERKLWLEALDYQRHTGLFPVTDQDVQAYAETSDRVTPALVAEFEARTLHQTKAHIEAWNSLAGRQLIHLGMTSSDITAERDRQLIDQAAELLDRRTRAIIHQLCDKAEQHLDHLTVGRTHLRPAQPTTIGRRYAMWAEILYRIEAQCVPLLPTRGLAGAVGTSSDLLAIAYPDPPTEPLSWGEYRYSGAPTPNGIAAPGQTWPHPLENAYWQRYRSTAQIANTIATTHRLDAGYGLWTEAPRVGQTGSSAMPHKINPRYSEQIESLHAVLAGYLTMADHNNSATWYEGDVTHSAARRIYLPGIHLAIDAILNTLHWTLERGRHEIIGHARAVETHHHDLRTGRVVAHAIRNGYGREDAHQLVHDGEWEVEDSQLPGWATGAARLQTLNVIEQVRAGSPTPGELEWLEPR